MALNRQSIRTIVLAGLLSIVGIGLVLGGLYFFYFRQLSRLELYARYHSEIQFVKKLSNVLFSPYLFVPEKLPRYDLQLKQQDLQFLDTNLPAGYTGALLANQYRKSVPAKFIAGDRSFDVTVHYRGDTDAHWRDPQKSWRIDFATTTQPFDINPNLNLIIPVDRDYLLEALNLYRAKKLSLVVPATKFVNFYVNGGYNGVYWQVEQWGPEFLARNGIATSTNLYGSPEFSDLAGDALGGFNSATAWRKYASRSQGVTDFSDLQRLFDVINNPSTEAFNRQIGDVLDLDNFYAWQISQYLVSSDHQSGINLRLYLDPATGKFNFIPWDIMIADPPPLYFETKYNPLITRMLSNSAFLHERNLRLWRYIGDDATLNDDLAFYDRLDGQTKADFFKDWLKVQSNLAYRQSITQIRTQLIDRVRFLQNNLRYANAHITLNVSTDGQRIGLKVSTDGFSAIELTTVTVTGDKNCGNLLELFADVNADGYVNPADTKLATSTCSDGQYQLPTKQLIFSVKDLTDPQFLKPGQNAQSFIIISRLPLQSGSEAVALGIRNAVTGDPVTANLK